ncbi:MAG: PadR family transcriptional regulator [Pseudomonadota bacterium]
MGINLTATENIILENLASGGAMFGLQLVDRDKRLKRGSIYVLLNRLEKKGFVKTSAEDVQDPDGLKRRRFIITGKGRKVMLAYGALQTAIGGEFAGAL